MRLEGKVALITGASGGVGAAQARLFSREGALVFMTDVRVEEGEAIALEIAESGRKTSFAKLDVTKEDDWRSAVALCLKSFGPPTVLVNNAGIYRTTPILDTAEEEWDAVMEVNAKGVFLGTKHVVPEMKAAGGGSIVNISSTAGLLGGGRGHAYGASKGAVRLFTKYTAVQFAKEGVRANSIHPGALDTDLIADVLGTPEGRAASVSKVPIGRIGNAQDVANAALFLASDESSFVTGSELIVDGGLTAR